MRTEKSGLERGDVTPFAHWLRTGRWVPAQIADPALEVKFNPNHDPKNGRFTFKQGGITAAPAARPKPRQQPRHGNGSWGGGGSTDGGAGSFGGAGGGGGGDGYWRNDREKADFRRSHPGGKVGPYMASPGDTLAGIARSHHVDVNALARANKLKPNAAIRPGDILAIPKPGVSGSPELNRVTKNDYSFGIDSANRTHEVKGDLHFASTVKRSKTSQKEAGGADRRSNDDGGHFTAARFGGPTAAFNHFAQDANFNRGGYRVIEDRWGKDLREGKHVSVDITAHYAGSSRRPYSLTVVWKTNGTKRSREFLNEPKGDRHGR